MDFTEYTAIKNKFIGQPNLCDLFKLLSIETWKRIEYAYIKPRIKVFETTITQNLIFTINAYNDQYNLNIEVLEALDEARNGNDFELIIRFEAEGIEYYAPIQAKKVYRDGGYSSMDHGAQIESLMRYAAANNAKPMYLLYNFATQPFVNGITLPPELTGCTLIPAEFLHDNYYNKRRRRDGSLKWLIPGFYDLNPYPAFPWHTIVCLSNASELHSLLQKHDLANNTPINTPSDLITLNNDLKQGFYPLNTFTEDNNFQDIKKISVSSQIDKPREIRDIIFSDNYIDRSDRGVQKGETPERIYPDFSPKSRIIISKQVKENV